MGCEHARRPARPSVPPLPARFVDVTEAAGLDFVQSDGGCGRFYFPEQFAAGASLLDTTGDGRLDIYFPAPQPLGPCRISPPPRQRLYRNDGNGRFTLDPDAFNGSETGYAFASAVGDYDNDGCPDLFVCGVGRSTLYHNRGDGRFEDVTERAGLDLTGMTTGAVWFDYDHDGFLDLYVCRYCDWTLATDIDCLDSYGRRNVCPPGAYSPSVGVLYHNNGDGTFTDVTSQAGLGQQRGRGMCAAAADFDGDGRLDLYVTNDLGANFLYHNKGDGTFEEVAMREGCALGLSGQTQSNMGIAVGDYDGDGDLDVLVTTFSGEPYTLYRNDGGFFTDASAPAGIALPTLPLLGFGVGFFDARNSGLLDIFFANGHVNPKAPAPYTVRQRNQFFLNNGLGQFTELPGALPSDDIRVHRGACFGDLDNDGRIDLLVTCNNARPVLLQNQSPPSNWLLLRLINRQGCVTPVGTRCIATVAGKTLTRVLVGGGGYAGESDSRVHFGLGTARQADIEIRWLSGHIQSLKGVPANQALTVREGSVTH